MSWFSRRAQGERSAPAQAGGAEEPEGPDTEPLEGNLTGRGRFHCLDCDHRFWNLAGGIVERCPACGGDQLARSSLFTTTAPPPARRASPSHARVAQARAQIDAPGDYLVLDDLEASPTVLDLRADVTHIGRGVGVHIGLDDQSVSRRHAIVERDADGTIWVCDNRSLNGVFVNDEPIDRRVRLRDGDELAVGRYKLTYVRVDEPALAAVRAGPAGRSEPSPDA